MIHIPDSRLPAPEDGDEEQTGAKDQRISGKCRKIFAGTGSSAGNCVEKEIFLAGSASAGKGR